MRKIIPILALMSGVTHAADYSIQLGIEAIGSSEPVPIENMVTGWDGDFQQGELAFADASNYTAFKFPLIDKGWLELKHHYRRYYYLEFSEETAELYRAMETTGEISENKNIDLTVKHFEGPALGVAYHLPKLDFENFSLELSASVDLYQPGHFQFGELDGLANVGSTDNVAGNIDYRYDQDKILDCDQPVENGCKVQDVDKGFGYSLSTSVSIDVGSYLFSWQTKDLFNQFRWENGAFTEGCVNVGGGVSGVCEEGQLQNGFSGNQNTVERIYATHTFTASHHASGVSFGWLNHGAYDRFSVAKSFDTKLGRFGVFLYHPVQLGLGWKYQAFEFKLAADDDQWQEMRNLEFDLAIGWQW